MNDTVLEQEDAVMPVATIGQRLASAREAQEMSVDDVARALRLGIRQIEAIEAGDYDKLPGRTFVRGFIRNYARLMQLDPEPLLADFQVAQPEEETRNIQVPSQQITISDRQGRPWLKWLGTAVILVIMASWGVLEWLGPEQVGRAIPSQPAVDSASVTPPTASQSEHAPTEANPRPAEPVAEEAAQPGTAPEPAKMVEAAPAQAPASAPAPILLEFSGMAWVEVKDKEGNRLLSQNNQPGSRQALSGNPPFTLVIGSVPNVKLTYKGQPVDLASYAKADVARLTLE